MTQDSKDGLVLVLSHDELRPGMAVFLRPPDEAHEVMNLVREIHRSGTRHDDRSVCRATRRWVSTTSSTYEWCFCDAIPGRYLWRLPDDEEHDGEVRSVEFMADVIQAGRKVERQTA